MSFEEQFRSLSAEAISQRQYLATEEAVKTAIILRMLHMMEYNPYDPIEVIPEFIADVGIKKGEKVDYAIKLNGNLSILIECKSPTVPLDLRHASQLFRYFSVTGARFAILTNGFEWQFYSDLEKPNIMDTRPFLSFTLEDADQTAIQELSKFRKSVFDVDAIVRTASRLKYISALRGEIRREIDDPSSELVSLLTRRVYEGRVTAQVTEEFKKLIQRSFSEVVRDRVNATLSTAMRQTEISDSETEEVEDSDEIETTQEEWDGFRIATAIAARVIDPERVTIRDQKSYCGVLVDDNNRRPLVRLWFNSATTKYLGLFDTGVEEKVQVRSPTDLYKYATRIEATARKYAPASEPQAPADVTSNQDEASPPG